MSKAVVKAGIGYMFANLLIKGIGFLTLPVFSRVLGPDEFGIYNAFIAYDAILAIVVGLALHTSLKSANWEYPGKIDQYVSSLTLLYILNMFILISCALFFGKELATILGFNTIVIICLVINSVGAAIIMLFNSRISLQYSYLKYMLVAAGSSVGNVTLSLLLVFTIFNGERYLGRILGATIAFAIVGVVLLFCFWRKASPSINFEWWKFGIRYSLPIVFHGLSQVALSQIGRLMIFYMVSSAAAGIFGLAANLQIILVVLIESIASVWSTWFYEIMEGESASNATSPKKLSDVEVYRRQSTIQRQAGKLATAFAIPTICLAALAPEIIWLLGGDLYKDGVYCAFGIILSGYAIFIYELVVIGEYYKQKTQYIMWATIAAAVANFVLNYFAISLFGYIAAAYATCISYIMYALIHWVLSKRLLGFSIVQWKKILQLAICLIVSVLISLFFLNAIVIRISLNLLVCGFVFALLINQVGGIGKLRNIIKRKNN